MQNYEEVKLGWGGEVFTCPPNQVWRMIQHLELKGVDIMAVAGDAGVIAKCSALSECLKFLGMENAPDSEDVYAAVFSGEQSNISDLMLSLRLMVIPPNIRKQAFAMTPDEAEKKAAEAEKKPVKMPKKAKAS